jgi:histidinol-phosphate/aromatic aminotransferase/cobyric acid decarboxylase-like protein
MRDEMKANFDVLLTQYPSGLNVNSLLASKCFGVKQEYIVPGNGAAEIIRSLMNNLSGKIGVIYPTFEEYPNRVEADRLEIFTPANEDFSYSADDLMGYFTEHPVNVLLIINPDNPSGNNLTKEELQKLAQWSKEQNMTFIMDESFCDFCDDFPNNTLLDNRILEQFSNMIIIKSISKSFGVPGLRLGIMATSNVAMLSVIKKDLSIWNINSFAEFFMQIYSKYTSDYNNAAQKFRKERQRFFNALQEIPFLRVIPSQANYFLCEVAADKFSSKELAVKLLADHNILIKDCSGKSAFAGGNYIRLAVRDRKDNHRLVEALKEL